MNGLNSFSDPMVNHALEVNNLLFYKNHWIIKKPFHTSSFLLEVILRWDYHAIPRHLPAPTKHQRWLLLALC